MIVASFSFVVTDPGKEEMMAVEIPAEHRVHLAYVKMDGSGSVWA